MISEVHHFSLSIAWVFYLASFIIIFLPSLNIDLKCICCLACDQNAYVYLEPAIRYTNLHMEDQNIINRIWLKGFFHEFPLDYPSRDWNLHLYQRKRLLPLHYVYIEHLCSYLTLKGVFTTSLTKGFCLAPYRDESSPSGKHNCIGREGASLAPSPKSITRTQRAFALPDHIDTDVQVSFGVQRQVEWQENAENKKFSMPVHHSILTNVLRVLILLCSICSA